MENHNNENQMQVIHPSHRPIRKDNMIRKLKLSIFRFIFDFINKHLISEDIILKKLSLRIVLNVTKKFNERLLNMKLSDILYEQKDNIILDDYNRKIIDRIYEQKKERNVIKILELTFEEVLIIFRRKLNDPEDINKLEEMKDKIEGLNLLEKNDNYRDIEYFINDLEKNRNMGKEYIDEFKKVSLNYEKYFTYKRKDNK